MGSSKRGALRIDAQQGLGGGGAVSASLPRLSGQQAGKRGEGGVKSSADEDGYLSQMNTLGQAQVCPEKSYWKAVSAWVRATKSRYRGFQKGDLTQCFMKGPFAGWSERQVSELADQMSESAVKFPIRGQEELRWDAYEAGGEGCDLSQAEEFDYCPRCHSCGEGGCCGAEQAITNHGCRYAQSYARDIYYDKMIIDEFHKLAEGMGLVRDETGGEVEDPIGDLYDRAWKRVEEKYG